jgi:NhaP-type Na+/H+ or K+/H+ antiporter
MLLATKEGFALGGDYAALLLFVGIAVFAAIGALSHQAERAFSAALVYVGLGIVAAVGIDWLDVAWVDPIEDASILEHVTEFAVIIALFATGLKLDRRLRWRQWTSVGRLLLLVMPATIAVITFAAAGLMELGLATALILGAALAPTDPVLAGDIGVGPPGEQEEREPNFSITAEAGLNDGLALPFLVLGVSLIGEGSGSLVEWVLADVIYGIGVGLAVGAGVGWGLAAVVVPLRDRRLLSPELDRFVALGAVLAIFGLTELIGAYGFLAAFAGGVAFRRFEREHEVNRSVHEGAETLEKLTELGVILLFASMLTTDGLALPGWSGWAIAVAVIVAVRPLLVLLAFTGSRLPVRERVFLGWFGVRGVGSIYYAALALGAGVLGEAGALVYWTVAATVLISIVAHGLTGTALTDRLLAPRLSPEVSIRNEPGTRAMPGASNGLAAEPREETWERPWKT